MKHHSLSKVLKRLACVLAALVIALAVAVFALWHNELATLSSLKKLSDRDEAHRDGAVYQLNVSGGYYFDDFLARGGASTDSELISFITQSITKGIIPMNIKTSTIACSAFTADTQSGDRVFGRNYDFSATNTAIVYTNPGKGRHASYSTIDLSFLGLDKDKDVESLGQKILTLAAPYVPLDGVNDAGVACGIFMSYQGEGKGTPTDTQTDKPDLTSTTLLRLILDYADSVEDAVALAEQYDLHDSASSCFHYMVADSTGRSAVLEWVGADADHDADGSQRQLNVLWNDTDALSDSSDWQGARLLRRHCRRDEGPRPLRAPCGCPAPDQRRRGRQERCHGPAGLGGPPHLEQRRLQHQHHPQRGLRFDPSVCSLGRQ